MEKIKKLYKKYEDIILYLIFGGLTTLVAMVTKIIAADLLHSNSNAAVVSWVCAVTFAYVTNKTFVFKSKAKGLKAIGKEAAMFFSARFITGVVDWLITLLCTEIYNDFFIDLFSLERINYESGIFKFKYLHSPDKVNLVIFTLLAQIIVLVSNYIFSKLVIFKKKNPSAEKTLSEKAGGQTAEK